MTEPNPPNRLTRLEILAEITLLTVQQIGAEQREMQKRLAESIQELKQSMRK